MLWKGESDYGYMENRAFLWGTTCLPWSLRHGNLIELISVPKPQGSIWELYDRIPWQMASFPWWGRCIWWHQSWDAQSHGTDANPMAKLMERCRSMTLNCSRLDMERRPYHGIADSHGKDSPFTPGIPLEWVTFMESHVPKIEGENSTMGKAIPRQPAFHDSW